MPARFAPYRTTRHLLYAWPIRFSLVGILLFLTAAAPTPPPEPRVPGSTPAQQRASHWMEPIPVEQTLPDALRAEPHPLLAPGYQSEHNDWAAIAFQKANYYTYTWDIYYSPSIYPTREAALISGDNSDEIYPRLSKDASRIVYVSDRTGNLELYSTFTNGGATTQLTNHPAADSQPTWSPDDRTIAFVSNRDGNPDLYRMNSDGTGLTRLTDGWEADLYPTWSPDGQSIAWIRSDDQGDSVWIMNKDGSAPRMIRSGLYYSADLAWSPLGDQVAFDCDFNLDGWVDLMVMDVSGDNLKVLLYGSASEREDQWMGAWADDGRAIFGTRAFWVQYGSKWYFSSAEIYEYSLEFSWEFDRVDSTAANPDVNLRDQTVPTSHIGPLPRYSKNVALPLSFWLADPGPAGLAYFNIQVSDGGDWNSIYFGEPTLESPFYYDPSSPGSTLSFRSQARDWAGHIEPFSSVGDSTTTIYHRSLTGGILDNRGYPVVGAQPVASGNLVGSTNADASGAYGLYMENDQPFQANAEDMRFGKLPDAAITEMADQQHDFILPPADDSFPGGLFDNQLDLLEGWGTSGELPIEAAAGHSGFGGIRLGANCADSCLLPKETIPAALFGEYRVAAALDSQGSMHLVTTGGQYFIRNRAGEWQQLASLPGAQTWTTAHSIYVDHSDTVHVFFPLSYDKLYYTNRSLTREWAVPEVIPIQSNAKIETGLGMDGNLYLAAVCSSNCLAGKSGIYIWKRTTGGWEAPWLMAECFIGMQCNLSNPVATPDGSVSLVVNRHNDIHPKLLSRSASGIRTITELYLDPYSQNFQLFTRPDGGMQVTFSTFDGNYIFVISPGGSQTEPEFLGWSYGTKITVAPDGTIYYLYKASFTDYILVRKKMDEPVVANQIFLPSEGVNFFQLHVGSEGRLFFILIESSQPNLYTTRLDGEAGSASMSRSITIPANAHNPTLSFVYRLASPQPVHGALFRATVTAGTTTAAWETTERTDGWQHAYLDVTQFAGQEVQVTFTYQQQPGDAPAHVELDEITLGSWTTPVITHVTPGWLGQYPTDRRITIHGQNFMNGAQVQVGALTLDASLVTWLNDTAFEVTLLGSLPLGIHDIWVTNPDGTQAAAVQALTLGNWLYLPLTRSH